MDNRIKGLAILLFAILFNFFFWEESFGLNLVLFNAIFTGILFFFNKEIAHRKTVYIAMIGMLLTSIGVIYHNSYFSKWMLFTSQFLFLAAIHEPGLRSYYYLIPSGFLGIITSPFKKQGLFKFAPAAPSAKTWKIIKLSVIPFFITLGFAILYSNANPVFKEKLNYIVDNLGDFLANFFKYYSIWRILFIGLGLLLGMGVIGYKSLQLFRAKEAKSKDELVRKRYKHGHTFPILGLKNELLSGIITFIMLNVLLFGLNIIDIKVLWIQGADAMNSNFSEELHKGTTILIISILLSVLVVLYLFRGNLNFYSKNKFLKTTAYVWIIQNGILALSVVIRSLHYIKFHGLAHKRIGVIIFVISTFIGLIMLIYKVRKTKSVGFLLRTNAISIYLVLVISSMISWDTMIAKHNLEYAHMKKIDHSFLLMLSDKTLPILDANRDKLAPYDNNYKKLSFLNSRFKHYSLTTILDQRIAKFKKQKSKESWLSWNYYDQKTIEYFNK